MLTLYTLPNEPSPIHPKIFIDIIKQMGKFNELLFINNTNQIIN